MADVLDYVSKYSNSDVTIAGTTEKDLIASPPATCQYQKVKASVRAWAQVAAGSDQTSIDLVLHRGADKTGTAVGEHNSMDTGIGETHDYQLEFEEELENFASVQYALSAIQAGGTGNGTMKQARIEVIISNG